MNDEIDLLQIKIDKAREALPEETLLAINAVDWKGAIFKMRETKGYSFIQLGDLELETELLLCGLLSPKDYPNELQKRMGLQKAQVDALVNDINDLVFSKIREQLIKNTEKRKITPSPLPETPHPILAQKFTGSFQTPKVKTEYSMQNISKPASTREDSSTRGGEKTLEEQPLEIETPVVNTAPQPQIINPIIPKPLTPPALKVSIPYPPKGDPYRLPPE